jgi:3-oxoacyl-[acyl-carrier protein] reductase
VTATPGPARPLAGRRALVTGAASGIGRAAALSLAAAGATVAAVDADPAVAGLEAELSSADAGPGPHAAVCDVRDPAEVAATVARAAAALGGLDLVVTAAGSWRRTPLSMPLPEAAAVLRDLLEVNLTGTFLVGRAAAPYLSRDGGDLVLVSTDHVWTCGVPTHVGHGDAPDCPWAGRRERHTGGGPEMDAYDASKWALNGLTGAWSRALRPAGVRVNAVCPGATDTPMLRAVLPEPPPPVLAPADVAALVVALVLEGRGGRTGENVGAWPGHPLVLLPPGTGTEPTMDGTTVRRLELLEAREEVAARFAEYLHHLDAGYVSELVEVFTPDGRVEAVNFR